MNKNFWKTFDLKYQFLPQKFCEIRESSHRGKSGRRSKLFIYNENIDKIVNLKKHLNTNNRDQLNTVSAIS